MLAGEKRERERAGGESKSIHLSTRAQGLLNGIPYAGWWRVRERKGEVDCFLFGERKENFLDSQRVLLEPSESLNIVPF
jgi:hypothetical protein